MTDHEERRLRLEEQRRQFETWQTPFEAMIRFADITIRSLLLLDGGSALALLSFAGSAASHGDRVRFVPSLVAFGIGAALSVLTAFLAYLTQIAHAERDDGGVSAGRRRLAAIVCAFCALAAFCVGMGLAAYCLGTLS